MIDDFSAKQLRSRIITRENARAVKKQEYVKVIRLNSEHTASLKGFMWLQSINTRLKNYAEEHEPNDFEKMMLCIGDKNQDVSLPRVEDL